MKSVRVIFVLLILSSLGIPSAQADQSENPLVDKIEVKLGGYFTDLDTQLRLDVSTEDLGTIISLEDDLDFSHKETLFRLSGAYLFGSRHQFQLGYYTLDRDSHATINEEIEFEDEVFPINAEVTGFFDVDFAQFSYTYWALTKEKTALGVSLGVVAVNLKAGLDLVEDTQGFSAATDLSTDVPVPLLGLQLRQEIVPKLLFIGGAEYIYVSSIGDYSGNVLFLSGGLEYRAFENFGLGVNYEYGDFEVEAERDNFTGDVQFTVQGIQAYLRFSF